MDSPDQTFYEAAFTITIFVALLAMALALAMSLSDKKDE